MEGFWHKYLLVLSTTRDILISPFGFGRTIDDSAKETKRAALYVGEGVVFFYAVFRGLYAGRQADLPLSNLPFAGELLALGLIASAVLTGLITHVVASLFSRREPTIHASLASFLYWCGFCLFVIPPAMAILMVGSQRLFGVVQLGEGWQMLITLAVIGPLFLVYYFGTICSWIGSAYAIGPAMGGAVIACSLAIYSIASTTIGGLVPDMMKAMAG